MWEKIKQKFYEFNQGRNGVDEFGTATLFCGIACMLIFSFISSGIGMILSTALYVYTLFRMFSKNVQARRQENREFLRRTDDIKKKWNQFILRRKNSKEYKYFRCPKCHQIIRAKRGSGEKHIICKKCGNEFNKKC